MSFSLKLTQSQRAALDYIGRHRKTNPKIGTGTPCTEYMFNRLKKLGLVRKVGDAVMLTYPGERQFTKIHPYSKWRVK